MKLLAISIIVAEILLIVALFAFSVTLRDHNARAQDIDNPTPLAPTLPTPQPAEITLSEEPQPEPIEPIELVEHPAPVETLKKAPPAPTEAPTEIDIANYWSKGPTRFDLVRYLEAVNIEVVTFWSVEDENDIDFGYWRLEVKSCLLPEYGTWRILFEGGPESFTWTIWTNDRTEPNSTQEKRYDRNRDRDSDVLIYSLDHKVIISAEALTYLLELIPIPEPFDPVTNLG